MGGHLEGELLAAVRCRQFGQHLKGYHQLAAVRASCESHRSSAVFLPFFTDAVKPAVFASP